MTPNMEMMQDIEEVLFTERQIAVIVERIGKEISRDYRGKNLLLVSVLKGSVVFMADLMRSIDIPARIDFMATSSYGSGVKTSGVVKIVKDLDIELEGYDIVIVEDILDSGKTLSYLLDILQSRGPRSIRICTLFDKPERREVDVQATYTGAEIPYAFIAVSYTNLENHGQGAERAGNRPFPAGPCQREAYRPQTRPLRPA